MQVKEQGHIFAIGDITPFDEEKLGQNAELHADIVAKNLSLFDQVASLRTYITGNRFMAISLGPKSALLINGANVYSEGSQVSFVKTLVEKKTVFAYS